MIKKGFLIIFSVLLLALPFTAWAENISAKIFENGANNVPLAVPGVKVEVFGGYGYKAMLSSGESASDGGCLLRNVPLGRNILVKLTKEGYVTQYDIRSYSTKEVKDGVVLFTGSEANVKGLFAKLGETFDSAKGQVYLEITDENTGEGIEGIQFTGFSGKLYEFGQGEYLIANAEGASLKIGIEKPGYALDIESATIPLFAGAMTQYFIKVQAGGAIYSSGQAMLVTSAAISGFITTLSDGRPISCASVAFTYLRGGGTAAPSVHSDEYGYFEQTGFTVCNYILVIPTKPGWTFWPRQKFVHFRESGVSGVNFRARQIGMMM